jgi:hypothetical protein
MPITTGDLRNFLNDEVKKGEIALKKRNKDVLYESFIEVLSTTKIKEREQQMEVSGAAQFWSEGSARPELSFGEGWPQAWSQSQWAALFDITKPMLKFDQYDLMDRCIEMLHKSTFDAKHYLATAYLEYASTAQASVPEVGGMPFVRSETPDGTTICSASHAWRSGGATFANLSSGLDLTETNVNTIRTVISRYRDNSGAPQHIELRKLHIPPDMALKAKKLLESRLEPATGGNAKNTAPDFIPDGWEANPWLTDTDDWYGCTDATDERVVWWMGWEDELDTSEVNKNPRTGNRSVSIDFSVAHGPRAMTRFYYKITQ